MAEKIAIIQLRGTIGARTEVKDTLKMLRLQKRNVCVVYEKTPSIMGMVNKAKDFITWGEINEETLKELKDKRGQPDPKDSKKLKAYFRLNSPKKGLEKGGIKKTLVQGGALGYRKDKINDLIMRML